VTVDGEVCGTAEPVLVRGLFENIVGNAVKYSPPGAPVDVHVRGESDDVVVDIQDHGIGIPRDEIGHVFERFARASNAREADIPGTGFGLYFVRLVVQRHGGSVSIDSSIGEGTRVTVRLPCNPAFVVPLCVLVLEHDEHAASYTEHVLRDAGYRVRVVYDGTAFERALDDEGALVAVVPEGAYEELAAARSSGVPVIELRKPYLARDLLRELETVS
jgi:hypothetical protein